MLEVVDRREAEMSGVSHEHLAGIAGLKGEKKQTDFVEALELAGHVGDEVKRALSSQLETV